jgi:hypothetical protein
MLTDVQYVYSLVPRDAVACFLSDALRYLAGIFKAAIRVIEYIVWAIAEWMLINIRVGYLFNDKRIN